MSAGTAQQLRPDAGPGARGQLLRGAGLLISLAVLAATALLSLRVGSVSMPTSTAVEAFTAFDGSTEHLIVRELRAPRTLIGLGVGAALAAAGVLLQALTRNPLASPEILGVNAGASFAVVTAVYLLDVVSPSMYVWFAFAGAAVSILLVFMIASAGPGGATPVKLALAGAVLTALLASWISGILVLSQQTLEEARFWLVGSLVGRDLSTYAQVAPFLLLGLMASLVMIRQLDTITLGETVAAGLGQRTAAVRATGLAVAVLLAGASVAVAGPIAFVGLAVPHVVRALVGPSHRWLMPYAMIYGPVLLLTADVLGRIVARPSEVQVGIMTAIVGAPFLVHLVRKRNLAEL